MTFTSDKQIHYIAHGIITCSLPKSEWTHAAHFAAAVALLSERGLRAAETDMPGLIRSYNDATGVENSDTDGYHETITLASLRVAHTFVVAATPNKMLFEITNTIMASPLGTPGWLIKYWSKEKLFSVEARRSWQEPDLKPLDFENF